jgi:ABC-type Fe3+-citrate transport system substrate-binding protein
MTRTTLVATALAAALATSACGGSTASSVSSNGATVKVPSAAGMRSQIRSAMRQVLPGGSKVDVHMQSGTLVVSTGLADDSASKSLARQACSTIGAMTGGDAALRIESSSGSTLATC